MSSTFKEYIKSHSIDNERNGKVISRDDAAGTIVVRIGLVERTFNYTGANVGDVVSLICPDGDLTKAYITGIASIALGEGGIIEI